MSTLQLLNVWTDPEPGAAAFSPMPASMLWEPDDHVAGQRAPAFVFVHRWGGYPYDAKAVELGPVMAASGFGFLSVCLRRRGMEGQLSAMPDDDLRDIKLAVDYLHIHGYRQIYLLGEQAGGSGIVNYMGRHKDTRVRGIAWIDPIEHLPDWLRKTIGDQAYSQAIRSAGIAARQGAGMDTRIDLFPEGAPAITQNALAFLSTWGPAAPSLQRNLEDGNAPLLLLAETKTDVSGVAAMPALVGKRVDIVTGASSAQAAALASWAVEQGAEFHASVGVELSYVQSGGQQLFALHWRPPHKPEAKTVTLLMHGLTSSPLSPLFLRMGPILAEYGSAVLAVESRRSGWAGHESALLDYDREDLDAWVRFLVDAGYERIVLAGASMGSISIGRYQSLEQHPKVVGLAHLMPTADSPDWFRKAAGEGPYAAAVEQAEAAVADGRGATELIDIDVRQPPPNQYGGRFRWTQRAASWLSWWGPDADSRNTVHIGNARVPVLLLSGTDDSYNDVARFAELTAAAVNAPSVNEIWYPDVDHGLAGVEIKVARDVAAWMKKIGVL